MPIVTCALPIDSISLWSRRVANTCNNSWMGLVGLRRLWRVCTCCSYFPSNACLVCIEWCSVSVVCFSDQQSMWDNLCQQYLVSLIVWNTQTLTIPSPFPLALNVTTVAVSLLLMCLTNITSQCLSNSMFVHMQWFKKNRLHVLYSCVTLTHEKCQYTPKIIWYNTRQEVHGKH